MSDRLRNTLAAERARLGWSQARTAEAAGISRQSYAAVESGSSVPSTEVALRLAAAFGRPVDDLFRLPERPAERLSAAWAGIGAPRRGQPVRLTRIAGRLVAHPVVDEHRPGAPADGVVETLAGAEVRVRSLPDAPPTAELAVVGCDPAFGIVADALRRERGIEVSWSHRGSRAALATLARGEAHVAGAHLHDAASGAWNGRWVHELVPFPCTRVSFATWEQGLVVRPGTGRRIGGVEDLATGGVRLLNREEGSESRTLLDEELVAAGVEPTRIEGYGTKARGHLAVAEGIAAGAADAGVAIRAAGASRGLGFVPLREEAYELIVPDHFLELTAVAALLGILLRPGIRAQVEALGGYDGANMGRLTS